MTTEPRDFNKDAATWDEKPARVKLAGELFNAINDAAPLDLSLRVLDYGCATGLLTLRLAPHVHSVMGVDTAPGMLAVLESKAAALGLNNVSVSLIEENTAPTLPGDYDRIICTMTLHHVEHVLPLLKRFYVHLVSGGTLCIADLDPDGGKFHDNHAGTFHHGFDRTLLKGLLEEAGFANISDSTATEIVREGADGVTRTFSVFLMTGDRP
ncbi:MAG: putative methyltransferase YcgJ [Candidatus Hydrogenedentes bacterium ADurb.Bin179]|nr:MAG: putative methyltransferase YcgJ [Candidatus Hydrogenedentes bacterium ADurb.Bin179]